MTSKSSKAVISSRDKKSTKINANVKSGSKTSKKPLQNNKNKKNKIITKPLQVNKNKIIKKPLQEKENSKTIKKTIKKPLHTKQIKSATKIVNTMHNSKTSTNHAGVYSFSIIKDNHFRLQSQRVFFTYKNHIPFDQLYNFINKLFPIKQYIICHEDGDEQNPYLHTHISVEFNYKIDVRNCRYFDYNFKNEVMHPNIGTTRNWPASCIYCLKIWKKNPLPDNKNWHANFDVEEFLKKNKRNKCVQDINVKELCNRIHSYNSVTETIKNEAIELRDVIPLIAIYNNKSRTIDPKLFNHFVKWGQTMRKWQIELYSIINSEVDLRKVYWIFDEIGGQGKSNFCSYVDIVKKKDECLTISSGGSLRDISDVIRNWMERGASPKIIFIDLPRTFNDDKHNSVYTIIENIKNGRLTCTKYKGDTIQFYPPHVMVFSNWMPDVSLLSKDRWVILNLKSKHTNDINASFKQIDLNYVQKNELDTNYPEIDFHFFNNNALGNTKNIIFNDDDTEIYYTDAYLFNDDDIFD